LKSKLYPHTADKTHAAPEKLFRWIVGFSSTLSIENERWNYLDLSSDL